MSPRGQTRRRFLGGLTVAALTGCTGDDDDGPNPTRTTTTSDDTGTPTVNATQTANATSSRTATPTGRQDVTFETADGVALVGTTYGDGPCGVVLVPQRNEPRAEWAPQARRLAERGYLAFAIEAETDEYTDATAGVEAAVTYLRAGHGVERVVLVGAGTGGEAAVIAASRRSDVDGVVTLSATGGGAHAANLSGRTLFVASEDGDQRVVETTRALGSNATGPTEVVLYEGSTHGRALFVSEHRDDLRGRLLAVLRGVCAA